MLWLVTSTHCEFILARLSNLYNLFGLSRPDSKIARMRISLLDCNIIYCDGENMMFTKCDARHATLIIYGFLIVVVRCVGDRWRDHRRQSQWELYRENSIEFLIFEFFHFYFHI
ncbi:uncharacterized protein BO96DRAFT_125883 [Aspergillus niger CBS 101883]|uniref:uncharacterized protein n=1 Tax=Aspergillus lacticoffeatus (strain CBS 101883) TaxID=1450533 RepID=UPI000D7F96A9|nr:uncharacterized protein BO96DRAFT_125883 [Aspergillus niger CBS 101883]PYH53688.1 hypothetical protein BO96DRAFT_125883 [Aspergillus niger CBS 101883]RDH20721.1 hypothetical protein M747DRAFT_32206 [Aspergillus niger ATCC 13496]